MMRIAMGAVTVLSVWFGSALAAEAQQITPTGPMSLVGGATSGTYTGTITLPYASYFYVRINIYQNGVNIHTSYNYVPNPGTTTYNFVKNCTFNTAAQSGAQINIQSCLVFAGRNYNGTQINFTVSQTRPTSKTAQKTALLALQGVDRDRRRE